MASAVRMSDAMDGVECCIGSCIFLLAMEQKTTGWSMVRDTTIPAFRRPCHARGERGAPDGVVRPARGKRQAIGLASARSCPGVATGRPKYAKYAGICS